MEQTCILSLRNLNLIKNVQLASIYFSFIYFKGNKAKFDSAGILFQIIMFFYFHITL